MAQHPVAALAAHRPRRGDRPAGADHPVEQRLPARRRGPVVVGVGLLERVVDGDREVGERGLASAREHAPEAVLEERLRAVLAVVAVRVGDELLGLRHEHRAQQVGVHAAQRAAQPDVEEVGEVGVADVVVVGRVRGDEPRIDVDSRSLAVRRSGGTRPPYGECADNDLPHELTERRPSPDDPRSGVALSEVPDHRDRLPAKTARGLASAISHASQARSRGQSA